MASTTISNGVLALTNVGFGDGFIGNSANIFIAAGAVLDVSGRSDGTMPVYTGQTLQGAGTLTGSLSTAYGGTLEPGAPTGTLTVTNTVTLNATAVMNLNRNASPNCSRLAAPSISLGGTLIVTNLGALLQPGDTFSLFQGPLSGSFGAIVLPPYYNWNTNNLSTNGTISVISVQPGPSFTGVASSAGIVTLNLTNGPANAPCVLLSSTNMATPLSQWTPLATNTLDANGNLMGLTVPADPTATQEFYLLELLP